MTTLATLITVETSPYCDYLCSAMHSTSGDEGTPPPSHAKSFAELQSRTNCGDDVPKIALTPNMTSDDSEFCREVSERNKKTLRASHNTEEPC